MYCTKYTSIQPNNLLLGNERLDSAGDVIACSNVPEGEEVPVSISIKVKDGVKLESNKEYKIRFNLPGIF